MGAFEPKGAVIVAVEPDSPGERAGLLAGDAIVKVNGRPPADLMDLLDLADNGPLELLFRRDGNTLECSVRKSPEEALGIEFSDTLFNRVKTCRNKCVFCFMEQMPKKMRSSLYYRDDDYRLSSIHGNFITLTNLSEEEWDRIRDQRISPLYVSVHATDEDLREYLLGSTRQAKMNFMERLNQLCEWGIDVHTQIVLMPDLNDKEHLDKSLTDLIALYPSVLSVSVVPVGLTKYRSHMPLLKPFTPEMVPGLLKQVGAYQQRCMAEFDEPIVYLSDEFYLMAGLPMPPHQHYGDYAQIENGVGMVRHFQVDYARRKSNLARRVHPDLRWVMLTGEYGGMIFPPLIEDLHRRVGRHVIDLCPVANEFFGELARCAGLMSGRDVLKRLEDFRPQLSGENVRVMVPGVALKDAAVVADYNGADSSQGLFLDDVSLQSLADHFGVPFVNAGSDCIDWLQTLYDGVGLGVTHPNPSSPSQVVIHNYPLHAARDISLTPAVFVKPKSSFTELTSSDGGSCRLPSIAGDLGRPLA
jgi:putative radical SAM enzyme (TIGR03279 family)